MIITMIVTILLSKIERALDLPPLCSLPVMFIGWILCTWYVLYGLAGFFKNAP